MKSIKEAYRRFLNTDYGTSLYNAFKLILYGTEDSLVQTLNNNLLQNLLLIQKDCLDVCDIGGGDGGRITHIMKFLHSKFDVLFRLDFIEQSQQYVEAFDTKQIAPFCETTLFHALFEDFTAPKHYDLVFLIHSIFAFDNGGDIEKVLSMPGTDGKILIVSNAPRSFLGGLKLLVDEGYGDRRYEIDDLQRDLEKRKIAFDKIEFQTKWVIDMIRYERDIQTVLEWISLGTYSAFTAEKMKLINQYISDKTVQKGNRTFFTEDEVVLVIPPI